MKKISLEPKVMSQFSPTTSSRVRRRASFMVCCKAGRIEPLTMPKTSSGVYLFPKGGDEGRFRTMTLGKGRPPAIDMHDLLRTRLLMIVAAAFLLAPAKTWAQDVYYPEPGEAWQQRSAVDVGMDPQKLAAAIDFARAHESDASVDLEEAHYVGFGREPFGEAVGPFKSRGDMSGVIVRDGYVVAEWGEPERVDMTFSVTKSFLSTTVGVAWDRGLIGALNDPVWEYVAPVVPADPNGSNDAGMDRVADALDLFGTEHNRKITWDHLLRQTSDWEGVLWGKPDWADRPEGEPETWRTRERHEPGTVYKYNDVRVNLLALVATNVWREPLPHVLRREIMDPIGASNTWRWYGYENSWIVLDGVRVQAVSGGGHWGGGMWISARDLARFGYFTLSRGVWEGRRLLSEEWFDAAVTPTSPEPGYGFMNFFLNTNRERFPDAPESAYAHLGAGVNMVYVDPVHNLVVVARWIEGDAMAEFVRLVLASIDDE